MKKIRVTNMNKIVSHITRKTLRTLGVKDIEFFKHQHLGRSYYWTDFPTVIQLDLCNRCGPKYTGILCKYCKPQRDVICGIKQHREMDDEVIDWVLKDVSRYGQKMAFITDFLDGDGLDSCLPEKRRRIKKAAPWLRIQTFTCGTRPENAELLLGSELDWICVTLSAHNESMYKAVHGGDKFNEVLKTMKILNEKHRTNQLLEVHYVVNKYNIGFMADWLKLMQTEFPEWNPKFSPLVNTESGDSVNAWGTLSTEDQEIAIRNVGGADFWGRDNLSARRPCVLWDNDDVGADGSLLQCCRWGDKDWDYGNAKDYIKNDWSFRDYHIKKVLNRLRNPFCSRCNMKAPNWGEKVSKIDVRGVVYP
jgi:hypothetical protein